MDNKEFDKMWWENLAATNKELQNKGIPNEIIAQMSAMAIGRKNEMRLRANLARELIKVEPMPEGAKTIYYRDLEEERETKK